VAAVEANQSLQTGRGRCVAPPIVKHVATSGAGLRSCWTPSAIPRALAGNASRAAEDAERVPAARARERTVHDLPGARCPDPGELRGHRRSISRTREHRSRTRGRPTLLASAGRIPAHETRSHGRTFFKYLRR
jgi:hypothetical protein